MRDKQNAFLSVSLVVTGGYGRKIAVPSPFFGAPRLSPALVGCSKGAAWRFSLLVVLVSFRFPWF